MSEFETYPFYVPQPGADPISFGVCIGVGVGIGGGVGVSFFISVNYLRNKFMDFYQTCIDTLLGGGEELRLDFGDLDYIFKITGAL